MSTRTMAHYLMIMFMVMLLIFRLIVLFTSVLTVDFVIVASNPNLEMIMLLVTLVSIILFTKTKLSGGILYLVSSWLYYGAELLKLLPAAQAGTMSMDMGTQMIVILIEMVIPIFALFILIYDKKQEINPTDTKTDFFYKTDTYDRKYDDRADKNNYRTM